MAQYDVYHNPVRAERDRYPLVVDIQNHLYESLQTRWVMPLAQASLNQTFPRNLSPIVLIDGVSYFAMPMLTAPFFTKALGKKIASVSAQSSTLTSAIDATVSGY